MTNKKALGGSQFKKNGLSHYQRNKQYYVDRNRLARQTKREHILNIKKNGQCVDCGINDYRVLDFDHSGEKAKVCNVADLASRNWSIERIDEEISKCELRCANCHRIITHERRASIV